jgi:hypothetical protein
MLLISHCFVITNFINSMRNAWESSLFILRSIGSAFSYTIRHALLANSDEVHFAAQ